MSSQTCSSLVPVSLMLEARTEPVTLDGTSHEERVTQCCLWPSRRDHRVVVCKCRLSLLAYGMTTDRQAAAAGAQIKSESS
ncbi:hypothetical protein BDV11DRAFT_39693 [Aspergillus similis]